MFLEGVFKDFLPSRYSFQCLASRSPSRRYTWFLRNLDDPPPDISPRHEFGLGPSKRSLLANNPRDWGHSFKKILSWLWTVWLSDKITVMATMEIFPSLRLPLYLVGFCNFDPPAGLLQIAQWAWVDKNLARVPTDQTYNSIDSIFSVRIKRWIRSVYAILSSKKHLNPSWLLGVSKHNGFPL